ncbi:hypothetical protein PG994_007513 [Apiospora phragmitis]|uniref:HRDC domain-containing protein n=1 Tax=Apiospora phragmitis TaxID=2905665 RepID=A0ABR1V126_9PEZI
MSSSQSQGPAGGPNPTSPVTPATPAHQKTPGQRLAWPLSYRLKTPIPKAAPSNNNGSPQQQRQRQWWHYYRYSNTQGHNPALIYCKTKEQSQEAAELFMGSPVVGFDMEWPGTPTSAPGSRTNEGRIALFHIALHQGDTVDDLIAPALRAILESPAISKVGVGVMNADFARLMQFFRLEPKGAFELSHLHNLVHYGDEEYDMITTKLLTYAADDAYAGFMLYHCMNAKRLAMAIVPTLPVHAERYPGGIMNGARSVWLRPEQPGAGIYTAADFFRKAKGIAIEKRDENAGTSHKNAADRGEKRKDIEGGDAQTVTKQSSQKVPKLKGPALDDVLDNAKTELHELLKAQRTRSAQADKVPAYCVATNAELEALAARRPTTKQQLLRIRGMGPRKVEKYGDAWLGIIRTFVKERKVPLAEQKQPVTPKANVKRVGQSLEFKGSPPTPHMNTGFSFSMADASITADENKQTREESSSDESAFGSPIPSPSKENVERRRYDVLPRQSNPVGHTPGRPPLGKIREKGNEAAPVAPSSTPSRAPPNMTPSLSKNAMIFEKKLTALSRMVVSKLPPEQRSPGGPAAHFRSYH